MLSFITEKLTAWEKLKAETRPIFIYGMGDGAEKIMRVFQEKGIPFADRRVVPYGFPPFSNSANSDLRILGQDTPVHVLLFYHTSREVVISICKKAGKRNKLHKFSRRFLSKKRTTSKISTAFFRQNRMPLPTLPLYPIKIYSFRSGKVSGIS